MAVCAAAGLFTTVLATPASAISFTMSSAELSVLGADPGLVLYSSLIPSALPWTFTLDTVGQSVSKDVFTIGTGENSVDLQDDPKKYPATANFTFSSPPGTSSSASGSSFGILFIDWGKVDWTGPAIIDFGNYGALSIELANIYFSTPGSANDKVTVTLTKGPVAIPVPTTLLLVGVGLASVLGGHMLRRRFRD